MKSVDIQHSNGANKMDTMLIKWMIELELKGLSSMYVQIYIPLPLLTM